MKLKSFDSMNCSLAQTLSVIGERWSLLIIRDASFGLCRFDDFQKSLGVARNMLSTRLKQLCQAGVLEKSLDDSGRGQYTLTEKGWDLMPALLSMTHWGDKYLPNEKGERIVFVDKQTGKPVQNMSVRDAEGRELKYFEYKSKLGPATRDETMGKG